jgi:hypothetical protein
LVGDLPNIYFVLDRSGSMARDGKWDTIRTVVGDVIRQVGGRARFGATVYPGSTAACSAGMEVMALRPGNRPDSSYNSVASQLLAATAIPAAGGTPTAITLENLRERLDASDGGFTGQTYVILATDGAPNCNLSATCDIESCTANIESQTPDCRPGGTENCCAGDYNFLCVDKQPLLQAVAKLKDRGVPTYVIGVPGSSPYEKLLGDVAKVAGTARTEAPYYYRVSSVDRSAFATAISQVAAKITAACKLKLATIQDRTLVNVYLDNKAVPQDSVDGWKFTDDGVELVGKTCTTVLDGNALSLRVVEGCPTLQPR